MKWNWNEFWIGVGEGYMTALGFLLVIAACAMITLTLRHIGAI